MPGRAPRGCRAQRGPPKATQEGGLEGKGSQGVLWQQLRREATWSPRRASCRTRNPVQPVARRADTQECPSPRERDEMKAPRAKQLTLAGKVAPPFCCSTIRIVSRHTFKTAVSLASSPAASVLGVGPQRLLIDKACLPCPSGACWWTTTTATRTICSRRDAGAATSPAAGARQPARCNKTAARGLHSCANDKGTQAPHKGVRHGAPAVWYCQPSA